MMPSPMMGHSSLDPGHSSPGLAMTLRKDGRGDIMGEETCNFPVPMDLQAKLRGTQWMDGDPYHRVVLASNGYVNTLLSCWYNSKVEVVVLRDMLSDVNPIEKDFEWAQLQQFERKMQIQTEKGIFCVCTCRAILRDRPDAVEAVLSRRIGVDQIFHHFRILPRFRLVDAGAESSQEGRVCLWREYTLRGEGIECRVREDFRPDFLEMHRLICGADKAADTPLHKRFRSEAHPLTVNFASKNFGSLVLGDELGKVLSEVSVAKHPLQRALLAAGGNVIRIMSTYHLCEVSLHVHSAVKKADAVNTFERDVFISCRGVIVGRARSTVRIEAENVLDEVKKGLSTAPGALFRRFNCLPKFSLLKVAFAESPRPGFGRHYTLEGSGIFCEIREEFAQIVLDLSDRSTDGLVVEGIPELF